MGSEFRELVLGKEFMDLLSEPEMPTDAGCDVEPLGEALDENLKSQLELYQHYLAVAERQRRVLVNGQIAQVQESNVESERLLTALGNLEMDRLALVGRFLDARPSLSTKAGLGSANASEVKCESLYPYLSEGLAASLKATRASLRKAVDELRRVMAVNGALIDNGSRIIHTTIGIMTSVVGRTQGDRMSTYTRKGAVKVGKVQIRNLINRSV